ncbi:calcineurin-like phosphoesterase family protein [Mucilaginibacter sp. JRF]|uniref:calcineurin-like phosphoesterase C-terminal domain-containing protein n=1 Tax=Mucilaginibacter sp. JRF TaxID=2780088 RepID=UPI00187FECFD|nr:calcineurin-like phosphoesterase family protein [Mucilaginibacter sp. JRF]MBE9583169.1 calcineurin-like phosphoesterase family protein [Mucilaginibacter sp. JRF]
MKINIKLPGYRGLSACMLMLGLLNGTAALAQMAKGYVFLDANGNGKKDRGEKGIQSISVSNGVNVIKTDKNGKYELPVGNDNILFVIKPSGFGVPVDSSMLPQFYYIHKPQGSPALRYPAVKPTGPLPAEVNFALLRKKEDKQFRTLIFGDPQVYSQQDIDWFKKGILEEAKQIKGVAFGLSLGDLVGDNLNLFTDYKRVMATLNIPWYNMVGNHDLNFDLKVDSLSDESYEAQFGPANYAFEYGNAHFIILDDILVPDPRKNDGYWAGLRPDQLEFIKNDLANTDTSKLIVFAYHIPMKDYGGRAFRAADRVKLFEHLKNHRHVLMLSGHTHLQRQNFYNQEEGWPHAGTVHEYNAGTTSGDWYSGELDSNKVPYATMRDGTEKGYAFLNISGNTYTIDYKVAGKPATYQMGVFLPKVIAHRKDESVEFYANFFMGTENSDMQYRIDGGKWTPMKQEQAVDPAYHQSYMRWGTTDTLMFGRRPSRAQVSSHLWRGSISTELSVGDHALEIKAVDMFGRTFMDKRSIHIENPKSLPKVY